MAIAALGLGLLLCTCEQPSQSWSDIAKAVYRGDAIAVQELLAQGADPNTTVPLDAMYNRDYVGWPLLAMAVAARDEEMARILLQAGADPNEYFVNGAQTTPLDIAAAKGHLGLVKLLIHQGGDPRKPLRGAGWTLLHSAAAAGAGDIVRYLVELGLDPHRRTNVGQTAFFLACAAREADAFWALLALNAADVTAMANGGVSALHIAMRVCDLERIKKLIALGVPLDRQGPSF